MDKMGSVPATCKKAQVSFGSSPMYVAMNCWNLLVLNSEISASKQQNGIVHIERSELQLSYTMRSQVNFHLWCKKSS